jgi:hypothetical protein
MASVSQRRCKSNLHRPKNLKQYIGVCSQLNGCWLNVLQRVHIVDGHCPLEQNWPVF